MKYYRIQYYDRSYIYGNDNFTKICKLSDVIKQIKGSNSIKSS